MNWYRVWCLLTALAVASSPCCLSAETGTGSGPVPGVEWTKIQDLNPDASATNRPVKQKWAVVIGLSKFKENRLDTQEVAMDSAANEFYNYLVDPNGGRFAKSHVRLMTNSAGTRQNIMTSFESWLGELAGKDDLVVVFIATNGFPTTDGGTYLCAYDCALDNVYSTCIDMKTLMETIKKNVKSDRCVLVLQSCYSGAAELTSGAKALFKGYNIDLEKIAQGSGKIILSSSRPDQMTWGDAFSRNLIKALREQNGLIPLQQAFQMAKKQTEFDTNYYNVPGKRQSPVMKSDWKGNDLVLGVPPTEEVSDIPEGVLSFLSAEACYLKATNFMAKGDMANAEKEYAQAIKLDAKYADALNDYATLHAIKGNFQAAADLYKQAINVRPGDALFHANYARALSKLGKDAESKKELETAFSINPKDRVVLTALASRALNEQNPERAVRLLKHAVDLYPSSPNLHERLSYALVKSGDVDTALDQAREAVKLDPKSGSAQMNLGSSLLMAGDVPGALAAYNEAERINPNDADLHYLLGKTLESKGDKKSAAQHLERFVQLSNPADPRLGDAKQRISKLSK